MIPLKFLSLSSDISSVNGICAPQIPIVDDTAVDPDMIQGVAGTEGLGRPDLIFTDVLVPRGSGRETEQEEAPPGSAPGAIAKILCPADSRTGGDLRVGEFRAWWTTVLPQEQRFYIEPRREALSNAAKHGSASDPDRTILVASRIDSRRPFVPAIESCSGRGLAFNEKGNRVAVRKMFGESSEAGRGESSHGI